MLGANSQNNSARGRRIGVSEIGMKQNDHATCKVD